MLYKFNVKLKTGEHYETAQFEFAEYDMALSYAQVLALHEHVESVDILRASWNSVRVVR